MAEPKPKLLVVDDDPEIIKQIRWALADRFGLNTASDRTAALRTFSRERPPIVLLDLGLPPQPRQAKEGLATLEGILQIEPATKVIIVSGNAERANAVRAVERGAYDIFPKPIDLDQLSTVLDRVLRRMELDIAAKRSARGTAFEGIVGSSGTMNAVFEMIRKVARSDIPVLITGESGTGKELVANAIHRLSQFQEGPFVPIHCGAIPEGLMESELFGHEKGAFTGATQRRIGKFESAQDGTLFLDEIGELAPDPQVKLLRFLQEKVVERVGSTDRIPLRTRLIAATNRKLEDEIEAGRFREDLYFRLNVIPLELPPLRARGDDAVELAEHFAEVYAREFGRPVKELSPDACDAVRAYDWPGNIRELQNKLKRAVVMADGTRITAAELDLRARAHDPEAGEIPRLRDLRAKTESDLIRRALDVNGGNISKTAKALGVSRPALYEMMDKYGIERKSRD
ncbi:MAG: PEP-CTERM-box response regulator transcription factor [Planctomycetota bacterium]